MKTRIGCCCPPDDAKACAEAGFDYVEIPLQSLEEWKAESREPLRRRVDRLELRPSVIMGLFPPDMMLTGPGLEVNRIRRRVAGALGLVAEAGLELVIFGAGRARSFPEDWSRTEGYAQLAAVLQETASVGKSNGVTVAIEIISRTGTNSLNTIGETASFIAEYDLGSIGVVIDLNQIEQQRDRLEDIALLSDKLVHVHVPERTDADDGDHPGYSLDDLLLQLGNAGYGGRISIESDTRRFGENTALALANLKAAVARTVGI